MQYHINSTQREAGKAALLMVIMIISNFDYGISISIVEILFLSFSFHSK